MQEQSEYDHYDPYSSRFQVLVGTAALSIETQHRLLNGQRRQVSAGLGLSGQEIKTVMAIQADTLQVFAQTLNASTD